VDAARVRRLAAAVLVWAAVSAALLHNTLSWWRPRGVASLVFAACCISRASVLTTAGGFVAALLLGLVRVEPRRAGAGLVRRTAAAAVVAAVFVVPYYALRPPQYHNAWMTLWQGSATSAPTAATRGMTAT
jgi:hypothetical protein